MAKPKVQLASKLIEYFELLWQDQIEKTPELRPAFIRFDDMAKSMGYVETRFASVKYANGEVYHDVKVRTELLTLEPRDMVQALLHSIAHCLNYDRGVTDTTVKGVHNDNFKKTAEELGLETFWVPGYGYMTKLPNNIAETRVRRRINTTKPFAPAEFDVYKRAVI